MFTRIFQFLKFVAIFLFSQMIMARAIFEALVLIKFVDPGKRREQSDQWILSWAQALTNAVKIRLSVQYETPIQWDPRKRYIILSNHCSAYDIPLIYLALPPSIRMVAKKELQAIPFFGRAMKEADFVFIHRHNLQQALQDLEDAKAKLQDGIKLWMAPEGTRSKTGKLLPFKKGPFMLALQTQATIIPVGIRGSDKVMPAKTLHFHLNENVEVHIGTPIETTDYTLANKEILMNKVRTAIAQLADEPLA